jgi:hypothetical protein
MKPAPKKAAAAECDVAPAAEANAPQRCAIGDVQSMKGTLDDHVLHLLETKYGELRGGGGVVAAAALVLPTMMTAAIILTRVIQASRSTTATPTCACLSVQSQVGALKSGPICLISCYSCHTR